MYEVVKKAPQCKISREDTLESAATKAMFDTVTLPYYYHAFSGKDTNYC